MPNDKSKWNDSDTKAVESLLAACWKISGTLFSEYRRELDRYYASTVLKAIRETFNDPSCRFRPTPRDIAESCRKIIDAKIVDGGGSTDGQTRDEIIDRLQRLSKYDCLVTGSRAEYTLEFSALVVINPIGESDLQSGDRIDISSYSTKTLIKISESIVMSDDDRRAFDAERRDRDAISFDEMCSRLESRVGPLSEKYPWLEIVRAKGGGFKDLVSSNQEIH